MLYLGLESLSRTVSWVGAAFSPKPIMTSIVKTHRRNLSSSSTASTATDASIPTPVSAVTGARNDAIVIAEGDGEHEEQGHLLPQHAETAGIFRFRSISDPLAATLKSVFQRTATVPPENLMWTQTGKLDNGQLESTMKRRSARCEMASFRMLPTSYIGYGGLLDALGCLTSTAPDIKEVALYSQVYTLEELVRLTPVIAKFTNLRELHILDAIDDPPTETRTLCAIVSGWANMCPSLEKVRFCSGKVWEMDYQPDDANPHQMLAQWIEMAESAETAY